MSSRIAAMFFCTKTEPCSERGEGLPGGMGLPIARRAIKEGWGVIAAARAADHLKDLNGSPPTTISVMQLDLYGPRPISGLGAEFERLRPSGIDAVVNAIGIDVRKPFEAHSDEEI